MPTLFWQCPPPKRGEHPLALAIRRYAARTEAIDQVGRRLAREIDQGVVEAYRDAVSQLQLVESRAWSRHD